MATPMLKRKRTDENNFPSFETPQTTSEIGLKLVAQLKRSQDKNGRDVAAHFLDLPSAQDYPDYYQQIAMPISLIMIEQGLASMRYATMEALEGDLKRMVQNAKDYNDSRSEVFLDAERIRKALSNFMPKHNPAYSDPEYRAVPTPIPQNLLDRMRESSVSTSATGGPDRVKLVLKARQSLPISSDGDEDLQDRMMALLDELSIEPDAVNFEKKPPKRDYPDYYRVIERPTSISDVKLLLRQGKVKDWDHLATEVRLIWANAKEYNEPGSAIYDMAEELETNFEDKVQAAGAGPRAKAPRLSLSQPKRTQLKLKMATPASSIASGTVDNESLKRQKDEIAQAVDRANRASSKGIISNPGLSSATPSMRRSLSSVEPNGDVIMAGVNGTHSHMNGARTSIPSHLGQLPTPVMDGVPNGTPTPLLNGSRHPEQGIAPPRNAYSESDNPLERKFRDSGKGLKDALISKVDYMTHPNLPGDPKWKLSRFASDTKTQTSSFIFLPSDHFYLRLVPSLTTELKSRRNWKVCVSSNWLTVAPSQHVPGAYDFRLQPGENTIVVDAIAELKEGDKKEYAPPQMQFDFERIQLVIVLVASSTE